MVEHLEANYRDTALIGVGEWLMWTWKASVRGRTGLEAYHLTLVAAAMLIRSRLL